MKKWHHFYYWLSLAVILIICFGTPNIHKEKHAPTNSGVFTSEQRTQHLVEFFDEDKKPLGVCTGTAIDRHEVLTAEHCDDNEHDAAFVRFDAAKEYHKVLAGISDNADHIILMVAGTPFKNLAPREKVADDVTVGETVTMYGDGDNEYPPKPRYGKVVPCNDPSDLDQEARIQCYSFSVNPGDSGSAVFNVKGEIVGLLTYKFADERDHSDWAEGFALGDFDNFWLPKDEQKSEKKSKK